MKKNAFKIILWAVLFVIILMVLLVYSAGTDQGDPIRSGDVKDLREDITVLLSSFDYLVTLVISSFGVIAFLIAFQQNKNRQISDKAWGWLLAAIIVLVGAIIACLFSREFLLLMVTRNAVKLDLEALAMGRWITYCCLIFGAVLTGFFLLESAKNVES